MNGQDNTSEESDADREEITDQNSESAQSSAVEQACGEVNTKENVKQAYGEVDTVSLSKKRTK